MTSSDKQEIAKTVRFMRKYGISSLKTAGFEIALGAPPPRRAVGVLDQDYTKSEALGGAKGKRGSSANLASVMESMVPATEELRDEEMLFWSSGIPMDRGSDSPDPDQLPLA